MVASVDAFERYQDDLINDFLTNFTFAFDVLSSNPGPNGGVSVWLSTAEVASWTDPTSYIDSLETVFTWWGVSQVLQSNNIFFQ